MTSKNYLFLVPFLQRLYQVSSKCDPENTCVRTVGFDGEPNIFETQIFVNIHIPHVFEPCIFGKCLCS